MPAVGDLATIRTDQVGSLLRPAPLKEAQARHDRGELGPDGLRAAQDRAIRDVVRAQERHGVDVITDGEFRRLNFQDSFGASVSGYATRPDTLAFHEARAAGATSERRWDPGYSGAGPAVTLRRPALERLALARNLPLEEYRFASGLTDRPVKVTLIGPDRVVQRLDLAGSRGVYPDLDTFRADVVAIERRMVVELVAAGCSYVQIDEPGYTAYVDEHELAAMRARGEDSDVSLERSIAADNAIVEGFAGVTFGLHVCRGNQRSMWHREGAYDAIAARLFGGLRVQRLLLEYDTERAGSFEPLRFVSRDTVVVLGLVSTKTPALEDRSEVVRKIEAASRYVPVERLALSPQCGFASDVAGNLLSEDDQWRKLELVASVAEEVWGQATVHSAR